MEALDEVVRAGKARYIGFSEWTADQIQASLDLSREHGWAKFVSSQPQYSLLWREPEDDVIPLCRANGISQIVWSPLAQGALTGKYRPGAAPPEGSRATQRADGTHDGRQARRRRARARAAARADRRAARDHDGAARARVGAARRERRIGDRRRLAAGTGARQRRAPRGSSSTRRHSRRSTGDHLGSGRWPAASSARRARSSSAAARCSEELRAALGRLPVRRSRPSSTPSGAARRSARCSGRSSSRSCPPYDQPFDPDELVEASLERGTAAGCRRDRARARVGAALALAGAHDRAAGHRGRRAARAVRELRPADRRDGDARVRAGRCCRRRCGATSAPTARSTATWRPSSRPRRTRSRSSGTTRSTGCAGLGDSWDDVPLDT